MFFIIATQHKEGSQRKKTRDVIKDEVLDSLIETEDKAEPGLDEAVRNAKDPKEAVAIIKQYEELLKG